MTRSRLRGRVLSGASALSMVLLVLSPAVAQQDHAAEPAARKADAHGTPPAAGAPKETGHDKAAVPADPKTAEAGHPDAVAGDAKAPAQDGGQDVAAQPAPPPVDPTAGDRTALINQDVAQHPPQTAIASRDPSHLRTSKMKLGGLLDRSVRSLENGEVGRVIDVMTGDDGKPAALELDVGGFLGVGNRRIAVAWTLFDLSRTGQNDPLRVALSAAQVRSAPAMDDSGDIQVVTGATPIAAGPPPAKPVPDAGSTAPAPAAPPATATTPATPPASAPAATAPAPPAVTKDPKAKPAPHPADSAATPVGSQPVPRAGRNAADGKSGSGEERF